MVPKEAVVVGESFQVQYILEDAGSAESIRPPSFADFRLVSGPAFYEGTLMTAKGLRPLSNAVFTLQALEPGRYKVRGATIIIGNKMYSSNDAELTVVAEDVPVRKESGDDYFLRPGEDAYRKIRENLFLKVQVDRKTCYVGEPVLATFKLYSRLQSRSDIVKNPGFYGFTVYDLVNLSDKQSSTENIGGKIFDVHTIRKVQLFPLQAGILYIDGMEVHNRVEFSRSAVHKKTEQEIVEGVLGWDEEMSPGNAEIFENDMHTDAVAVTVKPLPAAGKPVNFQGAVGQFNAEAALGENKVGSNSEGVFIITIRGQGNFTQIDAPRPEWPAGMEVFEPRVSDLFDKTSYPLRGERSFSYPFVASRKGEFNIPSFDFHYFNPDSGKYQTVTTSPASFQVSANTEQPQPVLNVGKQKTGSALYLITGGLLVLAVAIFVLIRRRSLNDKKSQDTAAVEVSLTDSLLSYPSENLGSTDREFYAGLLQSIWRFFELKAGLSGTGMNKNGLFEILQGKDVDQELLASLGEVLHTCEAGMFTQVSLHLDKKVILEKTREILQELEKLF